MSVQVYSGTLSTLPRLYRRCRTAMPHAYPQRKLHQALL